MAGTTDRAPVPLSDRLHATLSHGLSPLIAELGGDAAAIARRAGIEPGRRPASYREMTDLLDVAAATLGCPDFSLRLARRQGGRALGPLSLAMRHSRSFGEAIAYVVVHGHAHSPAVRVRMDRRPEETALFVGHEILLPGPPRWQQVMEQVQLLGHLGAMAMTAGAARARRVHFRHQPLSPLATYRRYFGCEARFGQNEDGLLFDEEAMAAPIVGTDAAAYRAATTYIDLRFPPGTPPVHAEARAHLLRLLGAGSCDSAEIARRLGLHPRTLHRRLRVEGTSFQKLKDTARRDMLLYYIAGTKLNFGTVSERLGFAEQAVMTRFCRRVFGISPTGLRARERARPEPVLLS